MASKIIALAITLIINIAVAVVVLFFMLIAMNGFGERDATWGLGAYCILALASSVLASFGALFLSPVFKEIYSDRWHSMYKSVLV